VDKEAYWNKYSQVIPFYYAPHLIVIKELNLGKNKISEKDLQLLINGLSQNKTLTGLNLWGCELTDQMIVLISKVISQTKINELNIGNNPKITNHAYLTTLESSTVTKLVLNWNNLGNEGAKHLASLLTNNTTLQYLDLSAVDIQDNGLAVIILALQKNNSLTHLNLQNNNISDKSFTLLSDLLQTNKGLTYLSLRALNLGDNGVSILSKGLSANQTLTALDLQNNKIDNSGFFDILNAVNKTNLEHLHLQWNNIRNCNDVLGFIPSSKLVSVNLQGNKTKEEAIIRLEKEIAKLALERK